jgi:8-oxo-dGTP pyrophosphatase MutT (NUDIX family)
VSVSEVAFPLPAGLISHARQFLAAGTPPSKARLASTVVLLRPAVEGADRAAGHRTAEQETAYEVYAIRRAATMAFAAGMYAFPGGTVDPRDFTVELDWAGPPPAAWAARLGLDEASTRAVLCAAVREVFEESGVLLAGPDPTTVVGDVSGDDWEAARVALINREVGFADMLTQRGLVPRTDLLAPWSRWVTPEFEPRRYDTYFFVALLPGGQRTREVGGEAAHTRWAAPTELADEGVPMLPPTRVTLHQIARQTSIDDVLTEAATRSAADPVQPWIEFDEQGDGGRLIVPL